MEGFGGFRRLGVAFFVLLVVFGSMSSAAVARPTVGFRRVVGEVDPVRALPCDLAAVGVPENKEKVAEKYAPLLLNLLPRGSRPPSGPSTGINDIKT